MVAKKPIISVIIPVYNPGEYLSQCLSSVLNQSFKEIEIICIDDGSSDESGKICDEYAASDDRIKVIYYQDKFIKIFHLYIFEIIQI